MDSDFLKNKFEDGHVGVLTKTRFRIGIRHVQLVYMLTCNVVFGILRGSQGLAVVAMTDETRRNDTYIQIYDWTGRIQGTMLSSFFWGYALMTLPAEMFLRRCGGKLVLTTALLANGAILVALPTIVNQGGWIAASNAQLIMGMTQACLSPANQSLFQKWLPPYEKSMFSWIVCGGVQLGIIIAFPIIASMSSAPLGWELLFYSLAMIALSTTVVWALLTSSSPHDHPAVGDKEKEFIAEALECYKKKRLQKPWRQILKSPAFWGITCAHVNTNSLFVFYMFAVPAYLVSGLRIPIKESGWYAMLPFIFMWFTYAITSPTVKWLYKIGFVNYLMTNTQLRKVITAVGAFGSVLGLCLLSYTGPDSSVFAVILLCGILGLVGLQYVGFLENMKDISENFSGSLLTLSSVVANVVGALMPLLTGHLLNADMSDLSRWRIIFLSLASLGIACSLVYCVLGSGERQYWDQLDTRYKLAYYNDLNQLELEEFKLKEKVIQDKNKNDMI